MNTYHELRKRMMDQLQQAVRRYEFCAVKAVGEGGEKWGTALRLADKEVGTITCLLYDVFDVEVDDILKETNNWHDYYRKYYLFQPEA